MKKLRKWGNCLELEKRKSNYVWTKRTQMDSQFVHTFFLPYLTWRSLESGFDIQVFFFRLALCLLPFVKLMQNEMYFYFLLKACAHKSQGNGSKEIEPSTSQDKIELTINLGREDKWWDGIISPPRRTNFGFSTHVDDIHPSDTNSNRFIFIISCNYS